MKSAKQDKAKAKRSAEDWVAVARLFGEECITIQHDKILTLEQKLEKQHSLAKEMTKEIQNDADLKSEEKKAMIESLNNYIEEWTAMQKKIQGGASAAPQKKAKK